MLRRGGLGKDRDRKEVGEVNKHWRVVLWVVYKKSDDFFTIRFFWLEKISVVLHDISLVYSA